MSGIQSSVRPAAAEARRIVVKIGSSVLTRDGELQSRVFGDISRQVSELFDAGREVALKAVQNFEEIELRGIRQCMNLKSPHLVSIFDVKHNDRDEPFVIMEYVSGPSLRQLLDESPSGLGATKAARRPRITTTTMISIRVKPCMRGAGRFNLTAFMGHS